MSLIDLATAYLVMGMLYLIMPLSIWYALRGASVDTVREWCLGGILFGLGLLCLGLRGKFPDWLTYEVAAILINGAQLLRIQALSREINLPWTWRRTIGMVLLYALIYSALRHHMPATSHWHYMLSLVCLCVYFFWIAAYAFQLGRASGLFSAYWLVVAYMPLAVVTLVQISLSLSSTLSMHPLLNHWSSVTLVLLGNITAVIGNIAFMGLFVERAIHKQIKLAAQQARDAESRRLERQIARLDRARGLAMISASLAHELSQPVSSLRLVAEHAHMQLQKDEKSKASDRNTWNKVLELVQHVSDVISRIRGYIQDHTVTTDVIHVEDVHHKVCALLGSTLASDGVSMMLESKDAPLNVEGDPVQLTQVLLNVYRNAMEAPGTGVIRCIHVRMFRSGQHVHVVVTDNGAGFSEEALSRATEGFFSTKTGGLGMGLLISKQIIEAHRGELHCRNLVNGGACVEIVLPVAS